MVCGAGRPSDNRIVRHTAKFNNGRGIWFDTTGSGNVVEASFLEGNLIAGLQFEATQGPNWALNNVIVASRLANDGDPRADGDGIAMREARDTHIYNNTIVGVEGASILISGNERNEGSDYAANTHVFNNILVDSGSAAVRFWLWNTAREEPRVGSHRFDNNLYYGNTITIIFPDVYNAYGCCYLDWSLSEWQQHREEDQHSLNAEPKFVDQTALVFSLQANSPAIDAGQNLAQVIDDFSGTSRPRGLYTDIGAFERKGLGNKPR